MLQILISAFGAMLWQGLAPSVPGPTWKGKMVTTTKHKALGFSHLTQGLLPGHCRGRKGEEAGGGMRIFTQNHRIS